jgi:hypothetical protein
MTFTEQTKEPDLERSSAAEAKLTTMTTALNVTVVAKGETVCGIREFEVAVLFDWNSVDFITQSGNLILYGVCTALGVAVVGMNHFLYVWLQSLGGYAQVCLLRIVVGQLVKSRNRDQNCAHRRLGCKKAKDLSKL